MGLAANQRRTKDEQTDEVTNLLRDTPNERK